jgi:UDP-N-acetylmuramoylalanine--D-glutamate ligase
MHRPISWSALADASVGVWGLGVEGQASVRRLRAMGVRPVLVDDAPAGDAFDGMEIIATGSGGLDRLVRCDVVVKSPGISRYRPEVQRLEDTGVAVCGGLGLFLQDSDRSRMACITGTKGKSTTTALAVHLLRGLGHDARAAGNIGLPPWDPATHTDGDEYLILESSSFQVPDLDSAPPVVAVTSLSPDHLDWHGSVERYYADKLSLCTKPGVEAALVDGSDENLRANTALLGPHVRWVDDDRVERDRGWSAALGLPGPHNARNASIARAVLLAMGVAGAEDDGELLAAAQGFEGLPSRCHPVGHIGRVQFVDDSLSTNVLPTCAALLAFAERPVALLVGGHDRGVDYAPLSTALARRGEPTLVVTMPDNGPRIGAAVQQGAGDRVTVTAAASLEEAVTTAYAWAEAEGGGVVLLSPAAPSFGRFADYRARADAFADAFARLERLD